MKRIKKKITKKKILLTIILITILGLLLGFLFLPNIIETKEINNLKKEITMVDNYLSKEKGNINDINKYISKKITTGKRKKIETAIEKYLKDILDNSNKANNISKDKKIRNILTIENITDKNISTYIEEQKKKLSTIKDKMNNIDSNNYLKTKDIYSTKLYQRLISKKIKLTNYIKIIDNTIEYIDKNNEIINYLSNNKDTYKIENNKLIFIKRKNYNEFKEKIDKISTKLEYELIKDTIGPTINASDITIYKGNNISIKDKVKCIDDVDGEVECSIKGNYDLNKIGTYNISISASDSSNNNSNKDIKLIVREKQIYKNPYYTEVIRNQNTIIVYGLDSNNEYTKIIKVMPCSVGRSGQDTPTGTFTTSDKYRWGGLYGGVWGQYSTRIVSDILFHSVPYYSRNPSDLEWEEYNKLGSPASLGCVRMTVRDVKWLYDNCPSGMTVKIYDGALPNGVSKPSAPKIDGSSPNRGWDPTDPDSNNPWK